MFLYKIYVANEHYTFICLCNKKNSENLLIMIMLNSVQR